MQCPCGGSTQDFEIKREDKVLKGDRCKDCGRQFFREVQVIKKTSIIVNANSMDEALMKARELYPDAQVMLATPIDDASGAT